MESFCQAPDYVTGLWFSLRQILDLSLSELVEVREGLLYFCGCYGVMPQL